MHLEFVLPVGEGSDLVARLGAFDFDADVRVRRARDVVTWKRTETILAFVRICGASASVLEIESRLVERQLQGHLNRVLNAETANLKRSVASSARQVALVEQLEATGRLGGLGPIEQAIALARTEAPEASFTELADRVGVSRSRVQRAFSRLEAAARADAVAGDL
jgi:DNA-binding protein WhiA